MPDVTFASLELIPEGLREDAKQVGDKFVVNLVANKKLAEFRENNITISRERDEIKTKYERVVPIIGEDVEKFVTELTEARTLAQQVRDGKLQGTDKVESEVTKRVELRLEGQKIERANLETKLNSVTNESVSWRHKFERAVLDQQITGAVISKDSVANPEALPDILARASGVFAVQVDGSVLAKKADGTTVYGADGVTPLSPHEWLTGLVASAPYLGKASAGGGANGGRPGGGVDQTYGMSTADFQKLPPTERIRLARQAEMAGRKK